MAVGGEETKVAETEKEGERERREGGEREGNKLHDEQPLPKLERGEWHGVRRHD